jgi:hypothetical protein
MGSSIGGGLLSALLLRGSSRVPKRLLGYLPGGGALGTVFLHSLPEELHRFPDALVHAC